MTIGQADTLEDQRRILQEELISIKYERLSQAYAGVDSVTGAVGSLFYAEVMIENMPVNAMIDIGSLATIISFNLFKKIGRAAKIPRQELQRPDIILRDYNQKPIPIGAKVELTF